MNDKDFKFLPYGEALSELTLRVKTQLQDIIPVLEKNGYTVCKSYSSGTYADFIKTGDPEKIGECYIGKMDLTFETYSKSISIKLSGYVRVYYGEYGKYIRSNKYGIFNTDKLIAKMTEHLKSRYISTKMIRSREERITSHCNIIHDVLSKYTDDVSSLQTNLKFVKDTLSLRFNFSNVDPEVIHEFIRLALKHGIIETEKLDMEKIQKMKEQGLSEEDIFNMTCL